MDLAEEIGKIEDAVFPVVSADHIRQESRAWGFSHGCDDLLRIKNTPTTEEDSSSGTEASASAPAARGREVDIENGEK